MHALPLTSNPSPSQIAINGYSPLGVPDFHKYGPTIGTPTLLEEETIKLIALTKGVTPAQVVLNWEWMNGVLINPRVYNTTHMCAPATPPHHTGPAAARWRSCRLSVCSTSCLASVGRRENLDIFSFQLTDREITVLESLPQGSCEGDPGWYECCGGTQPSIPSCGGPPPPPLL